MKRNIACGLSAFVLAVAIAPEQGCVNQPPPEPVETCVTLQASNPAAGAVRTVVDCDDNPPAVYP